LLATDEVRALIRSLYNRDAEAKRRLLDTTYWVKGCSSLGRVRYGALAGAGKFGSKDGDICLLDIREATTAAAPRKQSAVMPRDNVVRVAQGARALSPKGDRMVAGRIGDCGVVVRKLIPQDLKMEIDQLTAQEAVNSAGTSQAWWGGPSKATVCGC
jgi:uncharacterized protein (DUF2252 family)